MSEIDKLVTFEGLHAEVNIPYLLSGLNSFAKLDMASQNRRKKLRRISSITGEFDATSCVDFVKP